MDWHEKKDRDANEQDNASQRQSQHERQARLAAGDSVSARSTNFAPMPDLEENVAPAMAIPPILRPNTMTVTVPDTDNRHLITDEQLEHLCQGGRDASFDWCLALLGASLGFSQNFVELVTRVATGKPIDDLWVIFGSLLFIASVAGAIAKYTEHRKNKADTEVLKSQIRNGKKILAQ